MSVYLDTSVLIPLFVPEAQSNLVLQWITDYDGTLNLADLVVSEFHAVVSRLVRQRALDGPTADTIRAQFELWTPDVEPVENLPADIRAAAALVRNPLPRLLSADAIHLATCRRTRLTLATFDRDLQSIADREGVAWTAPK